MLSFKFHCNSKRPMRNLTAFGVSYTRFVSPLMLFMCRLHEPMLWPSTACHLMIYLLFTNFEFGEDPHSCSIPRAAGESSIHTLLVFVYDVKSYTYSPPICANCCNKIICPYTSSWKWKTWGTFVIIWSLVGNNSLSLAYLTNEAKPSLTQLLFNFNGSVDIPGWTSLMK